MRKVVSMVLAFAGLLLLAGCPNSVLPTKLLVKGHKKVSFCLLSGVVCLAAVKILQQMVLPELEAAA